MFSSKTKLIVVCGVTASGKTALATHIAKKYNGELINADSRQVYRGMDIGTNKELDGIKNHESRIMTVQDVPFHLVDIVNPDERYTLYQFKIDVAKAIADIASREKTPILVGGTGLWIDGLIYNYQLPKKSSEDIFYEIPEDLEGQVRLLLNVDPDAEYSVDLKNPRRVVRALTVYFETGVPYTKQPKLGESKYDVLKIAPLVEMGVIERKIADRTNLMFEMGLVSEVKNLVRQYGWEHEAMTGIGYREFREVLGDQWHDPSPEDIKAIKQKITLHTRQYAKRQMTWFKRDINIYWLDDNDRLDFLMQDFLSR